MARAKQDLVHRSTVRPRSALALTVIHCARAHASGQETPSTPRSSHHLPQPGNRHPVHRPPQVKYYPRLNNPSRSHRREYRLRVRPRGSTQFSRAVRIQSRHKEPGTSMDRTGPRRLSRSVVVPPLIAADRERGIETTGSSQRLACRTFSPPTSHVSSLRSEYGQTACRQRSARSAQPWRSRTALDRLTVSRETAGACVTSSPATSSRHHRTGDEDGISKTDTVSAPTQLLCPNPAHWWREATLSRGDSLSCRGGVSQT